VREGDHELAGDVVGMLLEGFDKRSLLGIPLIDDLVQGGVGVLVLILVEQGFHGVEKVFAFICVQHDVFPPNFYVSYY
jgi:hypothetical protein